WRVITLLKNSLTRDLESSSGSASCVKWHQSVSFKSSMPSMDRLGVGVSMFPRIFFFAQATKRTYAHLSGCSYS
ncbi:unnamed protein product, partial [Brassica rapa subsp. narinosa]